MLYAEVIPATGGGTGFADMYSALDALPADEQKTLEGLRALHNLNFSRNRRHGEEPMTEAQREAVPPVDHPIIRTHPETGRKCLFLGDHAETIVGMGYDESDRNKALQAALAETVGLSMIKPGQSVYLRVNSNSGDVYPYSTSPDTLLAVGGAAFLLWL